MKTGLFAIVLLFNIICSAAAQDTGVLLNPERIYVQTDRSIYMAGEHLFFTMYLKGNPGLMSKYAYLILRDSKSSLITNARLDIDNRISYGTILLPDTLSSGFYQIVCYTNSMRNGSENDYFNKEIIIVNRFDDKLNQFPDPVKTPVKDSFLQSLTGKSDSSGSLIIHLDKLEFEPREKISFSIEPGSIPIGIASVSVSVSEILPGSPNDMSISDYFGTNTGKYQRSISGNKLCSFEPEYNGQVLQGRVVPFTQNSSYINKPGGVEYRKVLVSTPDTVVNMQFATTDSLGSFGLILNPYYEGKELFIKLKEYVNADIVPDDKFSLTRAFVPSRFNDLPNLKEYIRRNAKIVQVQRYYNRPVVTDTLKVFQPAKPIPRVYFNSATIFPSDYLELPDFEEIAREIVPALKIWKTHNTFVSGYINLRYQTNSNDEPSLFLDGVPVDDVNQIISLGSADIKRIESLPVIRYYGGMSFPGILSVFSKLTVINNLTFKTPAIRYRALTSLPKTRPVPFSPGSISTRDPDLRQVLLWEPELRFDEKNKMLIECYASDLLSSYLINIQGVTSKGDPVSASAVIRVRSKSK